MSRFTLIDKRGVHSETVVHHPDGEIAVVREVDVESRSARMRARVANRFVSDAVDLVANERMQLPRGAVDQECSLDETLATTIVNGSPEGLGEAIGFVRRGAERVD